MDKTRLARLPAAGPDGWIVWDMADDATFSGLVTQEMRLRIEPDARQVRLRIPTIARHRNDGGSIHGGVLLTLADMAMFVTARMLTGDHLKGSATLDLASQFLGRGVIGEPLDAVSEILRETGRMVFLRGLILQHDTPIFGWSGTLRKPSSPRASAAPPLAATPQ